MERERESDREKQIDKQIDRQIDRQFYRQTEIRIDRKIDRRIDTIFLPSHFTSILFVILVKHVDSTGMQFCSSRHCTVIHENVTQLLFFKHFYRSQDTTCQNPSHYVSVCSTTNSLIHKLCPPYITGPYNIYSIAFRLRNNLCYSFSRYTYKHVHYI